MQPTKRRRTLGYERRIILLAAAAVLPSLLAAILILYVHPFRWQVRAALLAAIIIVTSIVLNTLHQKLVYPLRMLSSLLAALREEDYSIRARDARDGDALGEVMIEANQLSTVLREQRLGALEATALLQMVIREIDASIFTFDGEQRLRLVNRAGERLLAAPAERLLGRDAGELGLLNCLESDDSRAMEISFPGAAGRWGVRKSTFRQSGRSHTLLLITDLSEALRDEERQAWQRLVRVLSHELNNSLTPIRSIAASLLAIGSRDSLPADWNQEVRKGLSVIASRSESLTRFVDAYARLARLPRPRFGQVAIDALIERVVELERRIPVAVRAGPEVIIHADGDQMEQLVINLIRNAADASLETGGAVEVSWDVRSAILEIVVLDEGPGLGGSANLFVPFYTTKPGGTGIGLALSRQIADAHGATLSLENRRDRTGCVARLRLPLVQRPRADALVPKTDGGLSGPGL
jgi:two-component system, NtrC family, nitrogen regulation sensor histidine kinase NtrY